LILHYETIDPALEILQPQPVEVQAVSGHSSTRPLRPEQRLAVWGTEGSCPFSEHWGK